MNLFFAVLKMSAARSESSACIGALPCFRKLFGKPSGQKYKSGFRGLSVGMQYFRPFNTLRMDLQASAL